MNSILERLYRGEIHPAEQAVPDSEEYLEWRTTFETNSMRFYKRLQEIDVELAKTYASLKNDQGILSSFEVEEMFYYGVCLGMGLAIEALTAAKL